MDSNANWKRGKSNGYPVSEDEATKYRAMLGFCDSCGQDGTTYPEYPCKVVNGESICEDCLRKKSKC